MPIRSSAWSQAPTRSRMPGAVIRPVERFARRQFREFGAPLVQRREHRQFRNERGDPILGQAARQPGRLILRVMMEMRDLGDRERVAGIHQVSERGYRQNCLGRLQ